MRNRLRQIVEQGADATAEKWLKVIENEYGRVPLIFKRMGERPEVLISHLLYKGTVAGNQPARSQSTWNSSAWQSGRL